MSKPKGLGKPVIGERGAKVGVYGQFGTGKTELVMSATEIGHLLVVDAEGRTQYYDSEKDHGFEVIYSKDVSDAINLLTYAQALKHKGERAIFAIDGFSSMWFEQQEVAERAGMTSAGTPRYDSWATAKKPLKKLYAMLFQTPVDCIITMRAKPAYAMQGNAPVDLKHDKADAERGLAFAVDLVVEMFKEDKKPGVALTPEDFYCIITKASGPKEDNPLPIGSKIINPSFKKLMALRLKGNGDFAIGDVNFENQILDSITDWNQFIQLVVSQLGYANAKTVGEALNNLIGEREQILKTPFTDAWALLKQHKEAPPMKLNNGAEELED